jgi:replicative DNA helicase
MPCCIPGSGYEFAPVSSAALDLTDFAYTWLVQGVLLDWLPAVIGGAKKTLKTTLALDLAISLGSGTPFLGYFLVPRKARTLVLSGECGEAILKETARRISAARRLELRRCDVLWQFDLPGFGRLVDRERFAAGLAEVKVEVVIIDPLYLCLLRGADQASAANLYEIGLLLWSAAQCCLSAGAMPIFVHHTVKKAGKATKGQVEPLDLDDLAFAGIGEFARQWLLVQRLKAYLPGSGAHALRLTAGSSAGHSGSWDLDVVEGILRSDLSGRGWNVSVRRKPEKHQEPAAGNRPAGNWQGSF